MPKQDKFSCIPKEPLIKLDKNGTAPIVKYTMPHDTSYSAKSFTPLSIEEDCFKAEHRKEGNVGDYERFEGKTEQEITQILHTEFSSFKRRLSMSNMVKADAIVATKSIVDLEKEISIIKID